MNSPVFLSSLAPFLNQFVQYKRALNRKYRADAEVLRLFDRYLQSRNIADWSAIDSALIDDFLKSRPRVSARSYNHLLGTVHRFFDFAVMQQWIQRNPVTASPRPETGSPDSISVRSRHCKAIARRSAQSAGKSNGTVSRPGLRDDLRFAIRPGTPSRRSSSADAGRCRLQS